MWRADGCGDPRHRPGRRHGNGCRDRRLEDVLLGAQSCSLDRVSAEAAHDRRQGQARQHHQAGQSIFAVAAGRRGNGRHPLRAQARNAQAAVALARLMERRPTKVAAVALANKIARMACAIMVRGERYKEPKLLLAA